MAKSQPLTRRGGGGRGCGRLCAPPPSSGAFGARRLARSGRTRGGAAPRRRAPRLRRQRARGGRAAWLVLQHLLDRARDARPPLRLAPSLPCLISVFRAAAGALLGAAFLWRRQVDARAPRFGETDRDRL